MREMGFMPRSIGDTVFSRGGIPGVVTKREADGIGVTITQKGPIVDDTQKRGYINGLNQAERAEFNAVVDRVRAISDPKQRVMELTQIIESVKADPHKIVVAKYLESELAHTMISYKIEPKEYVTEDQKLV
jgi:hypothetical protein